jgi:hypothetical protein
MYGLFSDGKGRVFSVGAGGNIYVSWDNGARWTMFRTGEGKDLFDVWGVGEDIYAVGAEGTIFYLGSEQDLVRASVALAQAEATKVEKEPQTISLQVLGLSVTLPKGVGVWRAYSYRDFLGELDVLERVTPGAKPLTLYLIPIEPSAPLSCEEEIKMTAESVEGKEVRGGQAYLPKGWYEVSVEYQIDDSHDTRICRETKDGKGLLINITQQEAS